MSSKKEIFLRRKISKSEKRFPRHLKYLAAMEGGSWGYNLLGALFGRMTLIWFGRCSIGWNRHASFPFVSIYRNFCSKRKWISHHFYEIGPPCTLKKTVTLGLHFAKHGRIWTVTLRLHYGYIFLFWHFPRLNGTVTHGYTFGGKNRKDIFYFINQKCNRLLKTHFGGAETQKQKCNRTVTVL